MKRGLIFGCLIFCFCQAASAAVDEAYLNELVSKATRLKLAESKEWINLIHYKSNLFSGYTSEILSDEFFNSPEGKTDPEAELNATLRSFFSDKKETDKDQNPQCRFIGRYYWLKEKLGFDRRMPRQSCHRFNEWIKNISPDRLTLIFPAGTDNSPSSMFGHTLFRIDHKDQTEDTRLRSYSINFAAETDETNGMVFAFKGIFGGYPGRFSIMPYYEKVRQYNDMEHRDIWEYQLNLTPDEIMRLLRHAWELGNTDFAYFFFLENCSYQLLALLDVARPGTNLKDNFSIWAIPSDTVAVILEEEGILHKAVYRPSARSKLRFQLDYLSSEEQDLVLALTYGEIETSDPRVTSLADERQALVVITAYDYLRYVFTRGGMDKKSVTKRSFGLLRARNKIKNTATFPPVPTPEIRFDQGHGTSRLALGGGKTRRDIDDTERNFSELRYRPAYHNLLDNRDGYTRGAQINFFDFTFRYDEEDEELSLYELMLIDIYSLSPRDRFFKPVSWKVQTGFVQRPIGENYRNRMVYTVDGGFGLNYGLTDDLNAFLMLDVALLFHEDLQNEAAIAMGPSIGMMWHMTSWWNVWLSGRVLHYDDSLDMTYVEYRFENNIVTSTNTSLRLIATEKGEKEHSDVEVKATFNWYFK